MRQEGAGEATWKITSKKQDKEFCRNVMSWSGEVTASERLFGPYRFGYLLQPFGIHGSIYTHELYWSVFFQGEPVGAGRFLRSGNRLFEKSAVILPAHRQQGIYSKVLRRLNKGHRYVLSSDTDRTEGCNKAWKKVKALWHDDHWCLL